MQIGKMIKSIDNATASITSTIGNICNKTNFTRSIFQDCSNAKNVFSTARKTARTNGNNHIKSLAKGVTAFAKEVGPVPFTTAMAGFCFLPIGGTSIGLVTGLIAKKGIRYLF